MYSAIVGEGLKVAIFDLQTSFWGLNRSEFNQKFSLGDQIEFFSFFRNFPLVSLEGKNHVLTAACYCNNKKTF